MKTKENELNEAGIFFTQTNLGEAIFIPMKDKDESYANINIRPGEWTVAQLRAMADFMEQNRDITIFDDGSGERVKLK